jgi:iron(III) transport system permease protein
MTLILLTIAALWLYQRQLSRAERYTVVMGKGYRPRLIQLGRWSWVGWTFLGFYAVVGALLPFFILLWASLLPYYEPPSMEALSKVSLDNFTTVLRMDDLWDATENTIILGMTSSMGAMFLTVLASWFIFRTHLAWRKLLDFVLFLPYAFPGMIVGVAFMILFLSFKNPLYNTIWIIVLAHIVNFLPIGSRFTHAAVVQVHKELEEAASASGAGFWRTLRHIWMPLLAPALTNGTLFLLILSFKVMSVAALLQGPDSMVLSVYLWNIWGGGEAGLASALSVLLVITLGLLTIVSRRLAHGSAAREFQS